MIRRKGSVVLFILVLASFSGCSKAPDDSAITDTVKARFFSDPQLKTEPIGINVTNGEVTLTGEVSSERIKGMAAGLTQGIPGVKKVNDLTQVKQDVTAVQPPLALEPAPAPEAAPKRASEPPKQNPPKESAATKAPSTTPPPTDVKDVKKEVTYVETPPAPPPPQPKKFVIPAGTDVRIQMIDAVNSDKDKIGSTFAASLQAPIVVDGEVVIPKGAEVGVKLLDAKSAGKFKGSSELVLALDTVQFQGTRYPLKSTTYEESGASRGKQSAKRIGIGAAVGTAIGAIAGGGKGAAIGAGIGAGGGAAVQVFTKGKQVQVPSETKLDFVLEQPVEVTVMPKEKTKKAQP